jgi:HAD superfamily hydrolase (TIGR01450 family)
VRRTVDPALDTGCEHCISVVEAGARRSPRLLGSVSTNTASAEPLCQHFRMVSDANSGTWVVDLDGVIWLAQEPIPGSADAVGRLRASGVRVLFATNNASPSIGELLEKLDRAGIPTKHDDLVTSAQAAASMLQPDSTAVVCAGEGAREALCSRGVRIVEDPPSDAVVVGMTQDLDYELLATASTAVRMGARFIGTNEDATYPTPQRLLPGAGAILAAVSTAAQATPEIAGKPHGPLVSLLRERAPDVSMVVGDRPSTDGVLAQRLGVPFALVRSGVTRDGREPMSVKPDKQAPDLASLVEQVLETS